MGRPQGPRTRKVRLLPARLNDKPHYVFHPARALRRSLRSVLPAASKAADVEVAQLLWGLPLQVYSREAIGNTILTADVFDLCVTETMHRLIDPGDVIVDVGANVGYLTSLAAARSGAGGTVIAYEPHPTVFKLLARNAAQWAQQSGVASVEVHEAALSDQVGSGELSAGPEFHGNMGLAALRSASEVSADEELLSVSLRRLDDEIGDRAVGMLKIDVEGHEPEVLRGAERLLERGDVRDIVFEDHEEYPDRATELVERAGYRLFSLDNDLLGLCLGAPENRGPIDPWPGPSYLATRDPDRAIARLVPRGWQIKGIGPALPWTVPRGARRR